VQQAAPVWPVPIDRSDRSHQRPGKASVPRLEYCVKEKKEEPRPVADPEKLKADAVVQIGEIKVPIRDAGKEPMDIEKSIDVPSQRPVMANDHEASGSRGIADKYHQPRWCPSGLTHTQQRKLQRLRNKEKKEQEAEKMRDEHFNKYRPMIPQGKVWQVKSVDQSSRPVGPPPPTSQTCFPDQSDRSDQPVEPSAELTAELAAPVSVSSVDETPTVPLVPEEEELVDYEASPECTNLEINVVHLSSDYFVVPEEDLAHLQFGPREAVFQKSSEKDNHLKALYIRGHINGKPVTRMLVDGGAIVNLMPYSLYKKLGG